MALVCSTAKIWLRPRGAASLALCSFQRCTSTVAEQVSEPQPHQEAQRSFQAVPGPQRVPVLGTTWTYMPFVGFQSLQRMHRGNMELYRRYGPVWREALPGMADKVCLCNPEDVATLFRAESQLPVREGLRVFKEFRESHPLFSTVGIVVLQGKEWQQFRSKVQQPMMKPGNVLHYLPAMQTVSNDFICRIRSIRDSCNEMPADFLNELYKWSLESIGLVALDTRLGCLQDDLAPDSEPQQLIQAVTDCFECMMRLEMSLPLWRWVSVPRWRRFARSQDTFARIAMKHIGRSVEASVQRASVDKEESRSPTVLEILLGQRGLLPSDACVMAIDMMMGAIDTTSHSLAFTLYHLARNPDKQQRLWEEVSSLMATPETNITPAMLNEMRYLKACVKETLRITPVVMGIPRTLSQDLVLGGYLIPKGVMCMAMAQVMGRLESLFPQADSYVPERWLKGEQGLSGGTSPHPFAYLPFGNGSRMCIGRRFAEQEMWLLLAKVIRNFRLEYHHQDLDCITSLVNIPDQPLRFALFDRSP